jgi:hypothetical protein
MGNTTGRQRSDHDGHDGHVKGAWQRFDDGNRATETGRRRLGGGRLDQEDRIAEVGR